MTGHAILDSFEGAWITSLWGWSPDTWGCWAFSQEGRRDTFLQQEGFPFLVVNYVTENAPSSLADGLHGKVVGFYEITDTFGHRDEFTHPSFRSLEPGKWQYALKASRAFEILPEYRPTIREFDPSIRSEGRELPVAKHGAKLPSNSFQLLKTYPIREVPVFGCSVPVDAGILTAGSTNNKGKGYVSGGAHSGGGYSVPPESDSEKELYILRLNGDEKTFLGYETHGKGIFKVGLSISPETRRQCFNRAMPEGAYQWLVHRSTQADGHDRYPDFKAAEKGEMAMKKFLADAGYVTWLGGEFYLADSETINTAWTVGRETALNGMGGGNG